MKPAVVIPAYNEEARIAEVVSGASPYAGKVIVVDDGSADATAAVSEKAGAEVVRHRVNLGKGAALRSGLERAFGEGYEYPARAAQYVRNPIPRGAAARWQG